MEGHSQWNRRRMSTADAERMRKGWGRIAVVRVRNGRSPVRDDIGLAFGNWLIPTGQVPYLWRGNNRRRHVRIRAFLTARIHRGHLVAVGVAVGNPVAVGVRGCGVRR